MWVGGIQEAVSSWRKKGTTFQGHTRIPQPGASLIYSWAGRGWGGKELSGAGQRSRHPIRSHQAGEAGGGVQDWALHKKSRTEQKSTLPVPFPVTTRSWATGMEWICGDPCNDGWHRHSSSLGLQREPQCFLSWFIFPYTLNVYDVPGTVPIPLSSRQWGWQTQK